MSNRTGAFSRARIVAAAAAGTAFEWYDFFLFGSLAAVLARHFFAASSDSTAFLLALGTFAAAPLMRPLGALLFGSIGDRLGRKASFLITMSLMGIATFLIGLLPTFASIGVLAPALLVTLRMIQGLALGGEYGGAATYVAEHALRAERGWLTSWLQSSAGLGLIAALGVTFGTRSLLGEAAFEAWGWRLPFLLSAVLMGLSLWMRFSLQESPAFVRLTETGGTASAPVREALLHWPNLKRVLLVLGGVTMAQGVVWYSAFFYTHFHLERVLKVAPGTVNLLLLVCALASVFLYLLFGWLSDRIGRKPVMLFGMSLAAISLFPVFAALDRAANPALVAAHQAHPVTVAADPKRCSLLFDPVGKRRFKSGCDLARMALTDSGVSYRLVASPGHGPAEVRIGEAVVAAFDARAASAAGLKAERAALAARITAALRSAGYPAAADPAEIDFWSLLLLLMVPTIAAAALYGPQAAWLIEMFPPRIRTTAMGLPLHIGGGWFGGLLPAIAFALVTATGDRPAELWWPVAIAATCSVVTLLFVPETLSRRRRPGRVARIRAWPSREASTARPEAASRSTCPPQPSACRS